MLDLEQLLRADGAAWRSEVDAQQSSMTGGFTFLPRQQKAWRAPLVAALITVVLAVAIAYLATAGGAGKRSLPALPVLPTTGVRVDQLNPASPTEIANARQHAAPVHKTHSAPGGDVRSMPWRFIALLDHGRTILVTYAIGSPCAHPLGFAVQEGRNAVELAALSRLSSPPNGCEQSLLFRAGTIHLDRPLTGRLLLHAPARRLIGPQNR
jgi:hypothetical protein